MSCLLVVGMGQLGSQLAELARSTPYGLNVVGVSRSPRPASVCGDVTKVETLHALRGTCPAPTAIVYAVSPRGQNYEDIYVKGVHNVLTVWPGSRLVLISSTAVYGQPHESELDDLSKVHPSSESELALHDGEQEVRRARVENLVVRASGIYGLGRTSLVRRLLTDELTAEEAKRITNRIHQVDLARIVLTLLGTDRTSGTYLASDLEPASLGQIQAFLRSHPASRNFMARSVMATGPGVLSSERAPGQRPRTRPAHSRALLPTRLKALGFQFSYPTFREGYDAILRGLA